MSNKEQILNELAAEEERFTKTISRGLREMEKMADQNNQKLSDADLEVLYQTYGVPKELSIEISKEKGWTLV